MPKVFKHVTVHWTDGAGKRVAANTPGAKPHKVKSKEWYGRIKNAAGKWLRINLKKTDKRAAEEALAKMIRRRERGEVGLLDPHEETKHGDLAELEQAYLDHLRQRGRTEAYVSEVGRLLAALRVGLSVRAVVELDVGRVDHHLASLTSSARTKNTYRSAILGLMNYLVAKGRLADNPLKRVTKAKGEIKRKRRAETPETVQRIIDAARTRGLHEAGIIRRGPRKGQPGATVPPEYRAKLERVGRGRALVYAFAVQTGLRASSIRKTRVCDLELASQPPRVHLPATAMKSGRDFSQVLPLPLAEELKDWIALTGRRDTDRVFDLPGVCQVSKTLKKDLAAAGVPYVDAKGRVFDFHSFRKCTGTMLQKAGVSVAAAMRHLDHSDANLTLRVYNDAELQAQDEAANAVAAFGIR
jgi:integrase